MEKAAHSGLSDEEGTDEADPAAAARDSENLFLFLDLPLSKQMPEALSPGDASDT